MAKKSCFVTVLYRSPSQSTEEFNSFKTKLEETIVKINNCTPFISIYLGDFNARNSNWWAGDATNIYGTNIEEITTQNSLEQIIDGPTHILPASASCIDLFFSSNRGIISKRGVHPSLFPRCHHQIIFAIINFKIHFPPAYSRQIWDFSKSNNNAIKKSLSGIDWEKSLANLDINDHVDFLTNYILNTCKNFIPNKIISIPEKDAPWMTVEIKRVLLEKAKIYRKYVKNDRKDSDRNLLRNITCKCRDLIQHAKEEYFVSLGKELCDPNIGQKRYWSILHKFLGKRKIPQIPPLYNNDSFVTNCSDKAELFNNFFAKQCTLINTPSILPPFSYVTHHRLNTVDFVPEKLASIIKSLNPNKAHGLDEISVRKSAAMV